MADFISIIDRIKNLKNLKTDSSVAECLNLNQSAFAERKRKGSIPYEELIAFCLKESVSIYWILTGDGQPLHIQGVKEPSVLYGSGLDDQEIKEIVEFANEDADFRRAIVQLIRAKKMELDAWTKLKNYQLPFKEIGDKKEKEG